MVVRRRGAIADGIMGVGHALEDSPGRIAVRQLGESVRVVVGVRRDDPVRRRHAGPAAYAIVRDT